MRVEPSAGEAGEQIEAARRDAAAAYGDGTLYVEKLIERPRHIELQVFGDSHGNVVHVFERECSLQRRHQKVIEESPSPVLAPAVRERMGAAAAAAARAVGYRNAGTIEFLLEGDGDNARFYFLEMNTRLQVEHPVTEAVTGVDLVRAQLDVAAGAPLPWTQDSLRQRGHAIECRIYAEDPAANFLPQAGPLLLYREPSGPGLRIDAGVVEGDEIGVNYDPMLAKLIASGETREAALERAIAALRIYPILGIRTNIPFLLRVLQHPDVRRGIAHTSFLDEHLAELTTTGAPPPQAIAAAALASPAISRGTAAAGGADADDLRDPWASLENWGR
jgi:acetyl/propionyl-CoA carboxylase alpha subunit